MSFFSKLLGSGLGGVFGFVYQKQNDALDQQKKAQATALANAAKTADLADQAQNKANAKGPNLGDIAAANLAAASGGASSTLLTGPSGIDIANLQLGKNTLLGS